MDIETFDSNERERKVDNLHHKKSFFKSPTVVIKKIETLQKNEEKVEHKTIELDKRTLENNTEEAISLRRSKRKKNSKKAQKQTAKKRKQQFNSKYDSEILMEQKEKSKNSLTFISEHVLRSLDNAFFPENSNDIKTSLSIKCEPDNSQTSEIKKLISSNSNEVNNARHIPDDSKENYTCGNFKDRQTAVDESKNVETAKLMLNEQLNNDETVSSLYKENRTKDGEESTVKKKEASGINVIIQQNHQLNARDEIYEKNEKNMQYTKACENNKNENIEAQAKNTAQTGSLKHIIKGNDTELQPTNVTVLDQINTITFSDETVNNNLESIKCTDARHSAEGNCADILYQNVASEMPTNEPANFRPQNITLDQKQFTVTEENEQIHTDLPAYENTNEITDGRKQGKCANATLLMKRHITASNKSTLCLNIPSKPEKDMVEYTSNLEKSYFENNFKESNTKMYASEKSENSDNTDGAHYMEDKIKQKQLLASDDDIKLRTDNITSMENTYDERCENLYASKTNDSSIVHPGITRELSTDDMDKNKELHIYKSDFQKCTDNSENFSQIQYSLVNSEYLNTNSGSTNFMKDEMTQKCVHKTDEVNKMLKENIDSTSNTNNMKIKKSNILKVNASAHNLQTKQKKLSLLYISALDYTKQYESDKRGVLGETGDSNHNEFYSETPCTSNGVKNISCNSTLCNKQNFIKGSTEIDDHQPDVTHNFTKSNTDAKDCNMDGDKMVCGIKISEDLLKQENETYAKDNDVEQGNKNENLIYDAFSMKFTDDQFQIQKKTTMNNFTENYIKKNITSEQDEECNTAELTDKGESLNPSSLDDSLYTREINNKSPQNRKIKTKFNTDEYQRKSHFQDADEPFLITAMDCFKKDAIKDVLIQDSENTSTKEYRRTEIHERSENKEDKVSFDDAEDIFEMDDDFTLTDLQLTMIDKNMNNQCNASHEMKRDTYQQTEDCSHTQFGLDSVTVDIIDQLNYIRESVESIKELLSAVLKKE